MSYNHYAVHLYFGANPFPEEVTFATLGEAVEFAASYSATEYPDVTVKIFEGEELLPLTGECSALADARTAAWNDNQRVMIDTLESFCRGALTDIMALPTETTARLVPQDAEGWLFAAPVDPTGDEWVAPSAWADPRLTPESASTILSIALARRQGVVPSRGPNGELGWVEAQQPCGPNFPSCYWYYLRNHWCYVSCTGNTVAIVSDRGDLLACRRCDGKWAWSWGSIPTSG